MQSPICLHHLEYGAIFLVGTRAATVPILTPRPALQLALVLASYLPLHHPIALEASAGVAGAHSAVKLVSTLAQELGDTELVVSVEGLYEDAARVAFAPRVPHHNVGNPPRPLSGVRLSAAGTEKLPIFPRETPFNLSLRRGDHHPPALRALALVAFRVFLAYPLAPRLVAATACSSVCTSMSRDRLLAATACTGTSTVELPPAGPYLGFASATLAGGGLERLGDLFLGLDLAREAVEPSPLLTLTPIPLGHSVAAHAPVERKTGSRRLLWGKTWEIPNYSLSLGASLQVYASLWCMGWYTES